MSVRIGRSLISGETVEKMKKLLVLQPVVNTKYDMFSPKIPVIFYKVEEFADQESIVHIPFMFAAALFGKYHNHEAEIASKYPKTNFKFTGSLRDEQPKIVEEALEQLKTKGTTTIGLPPGSGKTVLGAKLSSEFNFLTCVLFHRTTLGDQWKLTFQNFTDARVWLVGEDVPPVADVILCMDTRIVCLPQSYKDMIGMLIIDEAHAFCTPSHVEGLLSFHPKYVIAETATLIREDGMHSMIHAICGSHGVFRDISKKFTVIRVLTGVIPERKLNVRGTVDWSALVKSLFFNAIRNKIIVHLVNENRDKKILILTGMVQHVKDLCQLLRESGETSVEFMAGNKKNYQDSRILVGTIPKTGTGFDIATSALNFDGEYIQVVMLVTSFRKTSTREQTVGRGFRHSNPIVYHLVDDDTILKSHWYIAKKWYTEAGATIQDLDLRKSIRPEETEIDVSSLAIDDTED